MCGSRRVSYFAHEPGHWLRPAAGDDGGGFTCDGCLVAGAGARYRCARGGCGFTLHEACARGFPRTLKSPVHPQHRLKRRKSASDGGGGGCEVCGEDVKGACYACAACGIALHPLCARMPGKAQGAAHGGAVGGHEAWLVRAGAAPAPGSGSGSSCAAAACGRPLGAWRYRCLTCGAELHPRCLVPAADQFIRHRGGGGERAAAAQGCCGALLHDVTSCCAISSYGFFYRFD
ncbi:uncharacterized protein LOC120701515 [Panicum virgatum]|uniref:DC1 domain-containing protein n=1 Tax=Panicum virgatum TaxID=38727 RepID=A0A8T0UYI7_PANVG|nr:uncharacterized protein LOC120701515 [Panicum virgatum]KAG2629332.1 hypothetical protein PVAP13_3KG407000 [Panicum virgatum]